MPNETEQDVAALRAEIDRQNLELLRLRDLLLARDAELGQALGRMAVLEHRAGRLARLVALARAYAPGFLRTGVRSLRRLRRQG
ncbi:MAG TPA: hypothetical protein VHA54_11050 [Solirubrobacterales bacterium]|nr:hypothetical protein [Solirubrobacterales bacterium]